MISVIHFLSK